MYEVFVPTKILYGIGSLNELHTQKMPGKKALIVISAGGSMRKNGYLARVQEQLAMAGCESAVYDKAQPNPTKDNVMEGAALGKSEGCDFVIGLGGGSPIDAAKAMAIMMTNPGDYWDYINGGSAKGQPFVNDPLPIVAVVTTAGTGTEADPWTVVTKEDTKEKIGFGCASTFPVLSVVDPELMLSVPKNLTAFQGFDALFHSSEGYIDKGANTVSEIYSEKSIALIAKSLAKAVNDGSDIEARDDVAMASTLAGYVQSVASCTSEHALAHAMGALHPSIPHGAALIMISKAYFSYFAKNHVCDDRMIRMAQCLGRKDASDSMDFVEELVALQKACGVDELKMSDYGFTEDEFEELAANARHTMGGMFSRDRKQLTDEDIIEIFKASYR